MKLKYLKLPFAAFIAIAAFACATAAGGQTTEPPTKRATIGVYYFDGWSGKNRYDGNPSQPWAKGAPTHLTKKLAEDFGLREPVWGWRNDSQEIMDRQITLAAENGVDFFLFCWYWKDNRGPINEDAIKSQPTHTSLNLYLNSKEKDKLKYCLLIANHGGAEIIGDKNWEDAVRHQARHFSDPQYVRVGGKPLVVIFGSGANSITDGQIEIMRETAKKLGFKDGLAIACCHGKRPSFDIATRYNVNTSYKGESRELPYSDIANATKSTWNGSPEQPFIPTITCGWDKRPWEGKGPEGLGSTPVGGYYAGDTPEAFGKLLSDAIKWMDENPEKTTKERIALIYAWNELGEGGYLVPTKGDPEAKKLKTIGKIVGARSDSNRGK